jgi:hypothetical protein
MVRRARPPRPTSRVKARSALCLAPGASADASSSARICRKSRSGCGAGPSSVTRKRGAAIADRSVPSTVSVYPAIPRCASCVCTSSRGTPRSSSAATNMSPATPAVYASTKSTLPAPAPRSRGGLRGVHNVLSPPTLWGAGGGHDAGEAEAGEESRMEMSAEAGAGAEATTPVAASASSAPPTPSPSP